MRTHWKYLILSAFAVAIIVQMLTIRWNSFLVLDVSEGLFGNARESSIESVREQILVDQSQLVFFAAKNGSEENDSLQDLIDHPFIESVGTDLGDTTEIETILFQNRLALFFPSWLQRHSESFVPPQSEDIAGFAESTASELARFLESPESFGMEDYVLQDPLLLLPEALRALAPTGGGNSLRWVKLSESAFNPSVQEELIPLFEEAAAGEAWAGPIRFAAASRKEIKSEVQRINLISILAVGTVVILLLKRPSSLIHVAVPVLFALGGGIAIYSLIGRELHVISLILGSVLTGISVDYGIHIFLHAEKQSRKELIRALLLAAVSSIIGFAMIAITTNPVIRDAGLLVTFGLSSALFAALLYPPLSRPHPGVRFIPLLSNRIPLPALPLRIIFIVLLAFGCIGLWQVSWKDDLRIMDIKHPDLNDDLESLLQRDQGLDEPVISVGGSYLSAIERLVQAAPGGLVSFLPNPTALARLRDFAPFGSEFIDELSKAFDRHDIDSSLFASFFDQLDSYLKQTIEGDGGKIAEAALAKTANNLPGPLGFLLGSDGTNYWAGTLEKIQNPDPNVFSSSGGQDLASMMAGFRKEFIGALLIGATTVSVGLLFFLGRGDRLATLLPLFGSAVLTLGGLAWFQPLNLFHLAGLLLGGCIGLDYLVFYRTFRRSGGHFPISIRFSLFTTSAAFLTLLLSRVEAVYSLGLTVLLFMAAVHLWIESDRINTRTQNT